MVVAVGVRLQVGSWAKGDRNEKIGYLLLKIVFFLGSMIFCFMTFPLLIIRLLMASRYETREAIMPH